MTELTFTELNCKNPLAYHYKAALPNNIVVIINVSLLKTYNCSNEFHGRNELYDGVVINILVMSYHHSIILTSHYNHYSNKLTSHYNHTTVLN